jgi:hypothetical protein
MFRVIQSYPNGRYHLFVGQAWTEVGVTVDPVLLERIWLCLTDAYYDGAGQIVITVKSWWDEKGDRQRGKLTWEEVK